MSEAFTSSHTIENSPHINKNASTLQIRDLHVIFAHEVPRRRHPTAAGNIDIGPSSLRSDSTALRPNSATCTSAVPPKSAFRD